MYGIISIICVSVRTQKALINGLTMILNCILLWNTSIWHNDVFYVHIMIYLKLQLTGVIRDLSSPLVDQSARCPVCELAVLELVYPQVVQLPYRCRVITGWHHVRNLKKCSKKLQKLFKVCNCLQKLLQTYDSFGNIFYFIPFKHFISCHFVCVDCLIGVC